MCLIYGMIYIDIYIYIYTYIYIIYIKIWIYGLCGICGFDLVLI
jgi:hypothetical protein